MLYIAMTGASQTLTAQAMNANNLANSNTTGFRADLMAFRAMPLYGPGAPSRVFAMTERPGVNLSSGTLLQTGRELDLAVQGNGYIAVQGADGREAFTRAGDLRVTPTGQLVTGAGRPVLGNAGPIALPPYEKIEIAADGTISIRPSGQSAATLAVVDRIKLVNPPEANLLKGADGMLRARDGLDAAPDANVRVLGGAIETSNVNAVDSMVNMITLSRQFELQVKAMRSAEENDQAALQLLRHNG
jgi:flagellar basal-body rod protein FlgF